MNLVEWSQVFTAASTLPLAVAAIIGGGASLRDWREKQRAHKRYFDEQAEQVRLDRRRKLHGWSPNGVNSYGVREVTEPPELEQAMRELTSGLPSSYVVVRINEQGDGANRAYSLRQVIQKDGHLARLPSDAEREALERGRKELLPDSFEN